ncbi:hypothetical protein [Haloarcula marina]|uniref:hypothetical protein n=1 Tax=Haloarcula marina TaxID=2961574 RepID=UPI0020B85A4D|nr:hypothetical protein [Halomicroarcula marina]
MTDLPDPKFVGLEGEYYHARFRDPDEFSEIRTPDWATNVATDGAPGSKVRTGRRSGSDEWVLRSVLIPNAAGRPNARSQARTILEKSRRDSPRDGGMG